VLIWIDEAFCRPRSIVVRLGRVASGIGAARMFGNTGAPACVGDRPTAYWRSPVTSVVLPADIKALARARSGTRS
jgi:hypothetical protein